jgi:uncharacterized protein (DUF608 family)
MDTYTYRELIADLYWFDIELEELEKKLAKEVDQAKKKDLEDCIRFMREKREKLTKMLDNGEYYDDDDEDDLDAMVKARGAIEACYDI